MRKNRKKIISIIVPVKNRHEIFLKTLKSILNQNIKDTNSETIIIDDGSSPSIKSFLSKRSPEVIKKIKLLRNKTTRGASYSRNLGLKLSKGDYISFLDSDDIYNQKFIETLLQHIDSNKKEMVTCFLSPIFLGEHKFINRFFYILLSLSRTMCFMLMYFFNNKALDRSFFYMTRLSGIIFTRKAIEKLKFSEKYKSAEDWEFILNCFIKNKSMMKIVPKFLVDFTYHKNSETLGRSGYWNYYYDLITEVPKNMRKSYGIKLFRLYTNFSARKDKWQKNL